MKIHRGPLFVVLALLATCHDTNAFLSHFPSARITGSLSSRQLTDDTIWNECMGEIRCALQCLEAASDETCPDTCSGIDDATSDCDLMEEFICNAGGCCNVCVDEVAVVYKCINKFITLCATLSCSDDYTPVDCPEEPVEPPDEPPVEPPVEPPGEPPSSGGSCFSSTDTVSVLSKGAVQMQHLQVGDQVLSRSITGQYKYQQVYAFGHHSKTTTATFYQIHTGLHGESPLEVTGDHLVFVGEKDNPIRADALQVGDLLIGDGHSDNPVVSAIKKVKKTGLYAPLTAEGNLVVNGIVSSSYIALQDADEEYLQLMNAGKEAKLTAIPHEYFAHLYLTPFRIVCTVFSSKLCQVYDSEGIPYYISLGMKLVRQVFGNKGNTFVQVIFLAITLALLLPLILAEKMLAPSIGLVVRFAVVFFVVKRSAELKKNAALYKKENLHHRTNTKSFLVLLFLLCPIVTAKDHANVRSSTAKEQPTIDTSFGDELKTRRLALWGDPSIGIVSPVNDFSTVGLQSVEVEVEFDASCPNPALVAFCGYRDLQVLLDGGVVAERPFTWRGTNSGSEVFDVDLSNQAEGQHSLTASAKVGWSDTPRVVSNEVSFAIGNIPGPVQTFVDETFVPGLFHDVISSVEEVDGVEYQVEADITIIEKGVVNLAKDTSLVSEVQCSQDGTVVISLTDAIDSEESAGLMFPRGAVLVVDGNAYGVCVLEDDPSEDPAHPVVPNDGFLVIDSMSLSSDMMEVTITGTSTSFFFLFDEADISMVPVGGYGRRLSHGNNTDDRRLVTFSGSKDFGDPPLTLTASADFTVDASIGLELSLGIRSGITLKVILGFGLSASATIELNVGSGSESTDELSATLYAYGIPGLSLPTLPYFDNLVPRAGLYLDLDFFWDYALSSNAGLSAGSTLSVGTGYKVMEFWVNGGWGGLSVGFDNTRDDAGYASLDFIDPVSSNLDADLVVFSGFRPELSLDLFAIGRWWINQRNGVELTATADSSGLPLDSGCSPCQDVSLDLDLVVENIRMGAWIGFNFDPWWFPAIRITKEDYYTLPGEIRVDLLAECFGGPAGVVACGDTCCGGFAFSCIDGRCVSTWDQGCTEGKSYCDVGPDECCPAGQLCNHEEEGCTDPPPGYIPDHMRNLDVSEIGLIQLCLGCDTLFDVVFEDPTLPSWLFDERSTECDGSPTSSRVWLNIYEENKDTGLLQVIHTDCHLEEMPSHVLFSPSLLDYYPRDGSRGIVEFLDKDTGYPYRADNGALLTFYLPEVY